jgi:hypothetical protein
VSIRDVTYVAQRLAPNWKFRVTMRATTLPFVYAAFGLLFILQIAGCALGVPYALAGRSDFRSFYSAGYAVRTGHGGDLYDFEFQKRLQDEIVGKSDVTLMFYHPPYESLLFAPFSFFSYRTAYFFFQAFNGVLLALTIWMIRGRLSHLSALWRPLPIAIFLCFFPIGIALIHGQDSILLLLLYTASFLAFSRGNDVRAGVFLGLALMKFQIAIPVALLFFLWRRWRFIAGFAASAASVLVLGVGAVGLGGLANYMRPVLEVGALGGASASEVTFGVFPQSMPNLRGILDGLAGHVIGVPATHFATAVLSLLVLGWAAMRGQNFPLALIAALLTSYHLNLHDLSLLAIPIVLTLDAALANQSTLTRRDLIAVSFAALLLFTPLYMWLISLGLLNLLVVPIAGLLFAFHVTRSPEAPVELPYFAKRI